MRNLLLLIAFLFANQSSAQEDTIRLDTDAVKTIDGIVNELLRFISIKPGQQRNLEDFQKLFLPTARFYVHSQRDSVALPVESVNLQEFVELLDDPYYEKGFTELELGKKVDEYNGVAHVFQAFYGKDSDGFEARGINSYQLVYFHNRWWIVNLLWTDDSNGEKIPQKYLD